MILWKSVLEHREDSVPDVTRCILADRDVLQPRPFYLSFGHQYYSLSSDQWVETHPKWTTGFDFGRFKFGYYSDFYDCEHHVLSFGPFYVYWSR